MTSLLTQLPTIRGSYREHADLSTSTWFRVGGKADILFKPADIEDLVYFLTHIPRSIPVMVLGVGSNLLVRNGGIRGVVIRLGREFAKMELLHHDQSKPPILQCGAGCLDVHIATFAAQHHLSGLEFLSGIPGTIGGALRMNGGAYGSDMSTILLKAQAVDNHGIIHHLPVSDMGLTYRHSSIADDWIFTSATLQGKWGDITTINQKMHDIAIQRETTQPVRTRTGGSTFKNPTGHKAWQLIDDAGCRGLTLGGAQVSPLHCNFLVNLGNATATEIEALGEEVRQRVFQKSGIMLEWEIKRVGEKF